MRAQLPLAQAATKRACFLSWSRFGSRAEQGSTTPSQGRVAGVCEHEGCFSPATMEQPSAVLATRRAGQRDALITPKYVFLALARGEELCQKWLPPREAFLGIAGTEKPCSSPGACATRRLLRPGFGLRDPVPKGSRRLRLLCALPLGRNGNIKSGAFPAVWDLTHGRSRAGVAARGSGCRAAPVGSDPRVSHCVSQYLRVT